MPRPIFPKLERLYIPWDQRANPTFILQAIARAIPNGKLPSEYTDAVIRTLAYDGVSGAVIGQVLARARDYCCDFAPPSAKLTQSPFTLDWTPRYIPPPTRPQTTMGPAPTGGLSYVGRMNAARILEKQFRQAEANANVSGMEATVGAALALVWEALRAYGKARQMGSKANEKMAEWEEFREAVNRILADAHGLRSHLRQISPSELAEMRRMPRPTLPSGMRIRLQSQLRNPRRPVRRGR